MKIFLQDSKKFHKESYQLYCFLEYKLVLHSDTQEFIDFFYALYQRFFLGAYEKFNKKMEEYDLFQLRLQEKKPYLKDIREGSKYFLLEGKAGLSHAYMTLFSIILKKIENHFLIHGAALSS